jgi:hypothetical protein
MKFIIFLSLFLVSLFTHSNENYRIEMVSSNSSGGWGAIRYAPDTGRSWLIKGGVFIEISEKSTLSKGSYVVKMVKTKKGWGATRIETSLGKGWFLINGMWKPVLESSE